MAIEEDGLAESELPTEVWTHASQFTPDDITQTTQIICPDCGGKSYLKDGKCGKCYHHLY